MRSQAAIPAFDAGRGTAALSATGGAAAAAAVGIADTGQIISFAVDGDGYAVDILAHDASPSRPLPRVAQAARIDFLSGLVTTESAMSRRSIPPTFRPSRSTTAASLHPPRREAPGTLSVKRESVRR